MNEEHGRGHRRKSLYEAALFGVKAISETWAEQPEMTTPISVSIVPVVYHLQCGS
jgi:hypothetical protein